MKYKRGILLGTMSATSMFLYMLFLYTQPFIYKYGLFNTLQQKELSEAKDIEINNAKEIIHENKQKPLKKFNPHIQQLPQQKESLSLAHLAHGFHTYAEQKKKTQSGDNLSISEIRFLEKLINCVITHFKINRQKLASYAHESYALHCAVSLSQYGSINNIAISKTSGNIFLDSFMKTIIQDAGASFPPVPQSIGKNPYMLIFDIKIGNSISLQILLPR